MDQPAPSNGQAKILSCFVVKFDVKHGNSLIWSKSMDGLDLENIEFRALPSSVHNKTKDIVLFEPGNKLRNTLGLSVYMRQVRPTGNSLLDGFSVDRAAVDMYSLGVLLPKYSRYWTLVPELESLLDKYLGDILEGDVDEQELYAGMVSFFKNGGRVVLEESTNQVTKENLYPLTSTVDLFEQYGPCVFTIWRACLLRQRVLLFNNLHNTTERNHGTSTTSSLSTNFKSFSDYVYIFGLLSLIPEDTRHLVPPSQHHKIGPHTLFNVGLLDSDILTSTKNGIQHGNGFIATTTDLVMLEKLNCFDVATVSDGRSSRSDNEGICRLYTTTAAKPYMQSSWYPNFSCPESVSRHLCLNSTRFSCLSLRNSANSPASLITNPTKNDKLRYDFVKAALHIDLPDSSQYDSGNQLYNKAASLLEDASYSFLWWASAGSPLTQSYTNDPQGFSLMETWKLHAGSSEVDIPVSIVGYFHYLTRRLFTEVHNIIQRQNGQNEDEFHDDESSEAALLDRQPSAVLFDPIDMSQMGLDPLSNGDSEFLASFVKTWWDRPSIINSVHWRPCGL